VLQGSRPDRPAHVYVCILREAVVIIIVARHWHGPPERVELLSSRPGVVTAAG
jgi:hypothetical protein